MSRGSMIVVRHQEERHLRAVVRLQGHKRLGYGLLVYGTAISSFKSRRRSVRGSKDNSLERIRRSLTATSAASVALIDALEGIAA